jgi:DNA-binding beta-propeller fold protein YncE
MKVSRSMDSVTKAVLYALWCVFLVGYGVNAHSEDRDVLAIGDVSDNSVRFFDAKTGNVLMSPLIAPNSGGLLGPTGILHDPRTKEWLVANQNVNTPFPGEVLRYDEQGKAIGALIPSSDKNAPFAPRGMVLFKTKGDVRILFVADMGDVGVPGKLLAYRVEGARASFIANLDPNLKKPGTTGPQFHPRGVVIGPDGYLYASLRNLPEPCGGSIARFDPDKMQFKDTVLSNPIDCASNVNNLHRPEGLVFSPGGDLYVTSFQRDGNDNDRILIISNATRRSEQQTSRSLDWIDLAPPGPTRASAQSLIFGPDNNLYVPILNTGEVRRYNITTKAFWTFISSGRGPGAPFYLSFGKTDPATLSYDN